VSPEREEETIVALSNDDVTSSLERPSGKTQHSAILKDRKNAFNFRIVHATQAKYVERK
jgi:hypothetical protein